MHTPVEFGFWTDPRTLAFCAQVKNPDAGAWILRLREWILTMDNADGRIRGYTGEQIAAKIAPNCPPKILLSALKCQNLLRFRKGYYFYPGWKTSTMGRYCDVRSFWRDEKRQWREARKQALLNSIQGANQGANQGGQSGTVLGHVPDRSGTVLQDNLDQGSNLGRPLPDAGMPPAGEPPAGVGATRWGWMLANYPKNRDPKRCIALLEGYTEEQWSRCQRAIPLDRCLRRGMGVTPFSDTYLEKAQWISVKVPTKAELDTAAKAKAEASKSETPEQKKASAWDYLQDFLADNLMTPRKKEEAKARFFELYGEKPWEKPTLDRTKQRGRLKGKRKDGHDGTAKHAGS